MSARHRSLAALLALLGASCPALAAEAPAARAASATALPSELDVATGENVLWQAELGSEAYAGPVVARGKVFVGTNNERPREAGVKGDRGVLLALSAADGGFLWQMTHEKLAAGRSQDWPLQGVCSTPAVEGDRLYYLSNRGEVVALDTEGFRDSENDGPFTGEAAKGERAADVVWTFDLIGELGVVPRFMTASSPVVAGDLVFAVTGNGLGEQGKVPAPRAPSFVALERATGKVRWQDASASPNLLDGGWGSPAHGVIAGRPQVFFPGADGWLYAFSPGGELLWKFDTNRPVGAGAEPGKESLIARPRVVGDRVVIGVGHDPEWGADDGRLWALDAKLSGDVTDRAVVWSRGGEEFSRTLSTPAAADGVLYAPDLAGFLHALEAETGKPLWKYDAFAAIWGSPLVADGKVYLGDEDGDLAILRAGRELKVLSEPNLENAVYTTPVAAGGVLYVVTANKLFALKQGASSRPQP